MKDSIDRRSFLKISGTSMGIAALYTVVPAFAAGAAAPEFMRFMHDSNGEAVTPFTFVQLSDPHVGFNGPPDPLGTKAFEHAVDVVNSLPRKPDLVLFTGDLTHDSEKLPERAERMKLFQQISTRLQVPKIYCVPGEHDAGIDNGELYHSVFGHSSYSFDHRGIHFIALDNVSRAKPEVGSEQLAWLQRDLARFPKTAPIVVFTHRPLFDLKPEWEWFTSDGDDVMNLLRPFENVTVLYGHIHRDHEDHIANVHHYGARSLIFAFPDPAQASDKKPIAFDKDHPFKNLGIRIVSQTDAKSGPLSVNDVELSLKEFSGINAVQTVLKTPSL